MELFSSILLKYIKANKGDKARKIAWSHWINLKYGAAEELWLISVENRGILEGFKLKSD